VSLKGVAGGVASVKRRHTTRHVDMHPSFFFFLLFKNKKQKLNGMWYFEVNT
jgi:hypothetical protein